VSSIISAFTSRPIFGYPAMVMSLVATGFIGFGLWVHHMFATGLPALGLEYFTAASIVIAIPTGHSDLLLDCLALARPAALSHAAAVRDRVLRESLSSVGLSV
jgi:hypothetical protein